MVHVLSSEYLTRDDGESRASLQTVRIVMNQTENITKYKCLRTKLNDATVADQGALFGLVTTDHEATTLLARVLSQLPLRYPFKSINFYFKSFFMQIKYYCI